MVNTAKHARFAYRSVFISDVHLGTNACQAEALLNFLKEHTAEKLFLVGDIVDLWAMSFRTCWTPEHSTVVQKILRAARYGNTKVIYIPGNHDEALREYADTAFGYAQVELEWIHETAAGKRYLVVHGDKFDQVTVLFHPLVAFVGDRLFAVLIKVSRNISWALRKLHLNGHFSLAKYVRENFKAAAQLVDRFEAALIQEAKARGLDGVVCGHIHKAALYETDGLTYMNCGDWVDSCTAIVETHSGEMCLVEWKKLGQTGSVNN